MCAILSKSHVRYYQLPLHRRATRNAHPKSPCCLPQDRPSPPCWRSPPLGVYVFDLDGFIVDLFVHSRRRIDFSPCSEGGAGPPAQATMPIVAVSASTQRSRRRRSEVRSQTSWSAAPGPTGYPLNGGIRSKRRALALYASPQLNC